MVCFHGVLLVIGYRDWPALVFGGATMGKEESDVAGNKTPVE